jgi:hypothetical protein
MLDMLLGAMLAAAGQSPDNPLNIPMPTPAEMARCYPPGVTASTPMSAVSRAQIRTALACFQALMAGKINSAAPLTVDEITSLESAETSGTTLQYNYQVAVDASGVTAEMRTAIDRDTRANVCGSSDMASTIGNGGAYRYVWNDRSGRPIHTLLVDRCP